MMRRLVLIAVSGALMVALAATAALTQEENGECPEGQVEVPVVAHGEEVVLTECIPEEQANDNERQYADVDPIPATAGIEQPQCFLPEGCFLSGDGSSETIFGGIGPDYIVGGGGHDWLDGQGGDDWLDGGAGDDLVRGEDGNDLVDGGTGNDFVSGGAGNDYVTGYLGNDRIAGGPGNDFVYAADGQFDVVSAGPGYDVCVVDWFDELTGEATPGHGCEELYLQ